MRTITAGKLAYLKQLSTNEGVITALALDQRGSLRKMIEAGGGVEDVQAAVEAFKVAVTEELTPYASSILLDPEYGIPASKTRADQVGLLMAYEETGYDASEEGRLPDLLPEWSAGRLKAIGSDAVKLLLYYDVDEKAQINDWKHAFVERIGAECMAEDVPFFLEIVSYDAKDEDVKGAAYARVKPHKVIEAMKEFSKPVYRVDVLKVEVPVNMAYVEGFNGENEVVYTREEAEAYYRQQDQATDLPYIYLSAGVSAQLFQDTLKFAHQAGAKFNGVLCGRATWRGAVDVFAQEGEAACRQWLQTTGKENIQSLEAVLKTTATPWLDKFSSQ